ncbi:unnamed protein product [Rotaria magnacalcarata]|uniref:C-CAP/cofactor C-like domain-containing protein n=1 Tax=Rotaria magnacalcarata TaxID=392030 RepID=A0A814VUH1_9BILA|nr:unnamed protein product [Rotaria magnacalcarata]CAF3937177.1 unnamed protein product [Rotaria magnacalcarata]
MDPYVKRLEHLINRLDIVTIRLQSSTGKAVVNSKNVSNNNLHDYNTIINGTLASHLPKLVLESNKWIVEYYSGQSDLKITETNMIHTIYVYKCSNSTLAVHGKVNSITLDQCTNVGIQFTSVVSLVEFVNCCQIKAQVMENVPTIQIEKTDGCHVYLSNLSLNTKFITSKSSEMTINVPFGDGEYKEYSIPEQFKICLQDRNNSLLYQMNHLVFKNTRDINYRNDTF